MEELYHLDPNSARYTQAAKAVVNKFNCDELVKLVRSLITEGRSHWQRLRRTHASSLARQCGYDQR